MIRIQKHTSSIVSISFLFFLQCLQSRNTTEPWHNPQLKASSQRVACLAAGLVVEQQKWEQPCLRWGFWWLMATERRVWFDLNLASSDEYCFVLIASQGCSEDGMKVKVFLVAFLPPHKCIFNNRICQGDLAPFFADTSDSASLRPPWQVWRSKWPWRHMKPSWSTWNVSLCFNLIWCNRVDLL